MIRGQGGRSGLHRGGKTFGGLGLQGQSDGSSVRNIFEGSFTEEVTVSVKAVFEVVLKFEASEAGKNFDRTDSVYKEEIGERSGNDWGANNQAIAGNL